MKASIFVGVSVDGFIARVNGEIDFLDVSGSDEDHGFQEFMDSVDALVMGRKTYEKVLGFGGWFYGKKPVFVLTTQDALTIPSEEAVVEFMSGNPADIVKKIEKRGLKHLYIDGGVTVQSFLSANFIQRLIITRVPVLIGEGIPLFGKLSHDIKLRPIKTNQYETGLVQTEYEVIT